MDKREHILEYKRRFRMMEAELAELRQRVTRLEEDLATDREVESSLAAASRPLPPGFVFK